MKYQARIEQRRAGERPREPKSPCKLRLARTLALPSLALPWLLLSALAGADTLTLKDQAFVRGPQVKLGDIAELDGERLAALADLEVAAAPQPGGSKRVQASVVAARLHNAGIDPAQLEMKGAANVQTTALAHEVTRFDIEASLREYILGAMPWKKEDTRIDIPTPHADLTVPEGDLAIEWESNPEYRYIGDGAFQANVKIDGRIAKTLLVKASIDPYVDAPVAAQDIARGRIIGPNDLRTQRMSLAKLARGAAIKPEELIGQIAQKNIFEGQTILAREVARPMLVERNKPVSFRAATGAIGVQGRAIAMNDARAGDLVLLRGFESNDTFQGMVQADGSVVVR